LRLLLALLAQSALSQECKVAVSGARAAFEARQFEGAAARFERALKVCPDRTSLLLPYGQVLYLLGKDVEAEQALVEAVTGKPDDPEAHYHLSRFYYQQNRFPQALEHGLRAVNLAPANFRAHDNVALCYAATGKEAEATRHFLKAVELVHKAHPSEDSPYADFANFMLEHNQDEKAFQLAAEAAARNPGSARNCYLTGKALLRLNKSDLSLRWFDRALELDPNYAEAAYALAQAYRKLGRATDADRALNRFKELSRSPRPRR
jgi:tetratricopeptide (TPR) repeat protein